MAKMKNLLSPVVILIIAVLSSCHTKDDPKPSKTDLISRTWKLSGSTANGVDAFPSLDNCEKDNLTKFAKDGKVTIDEGATKCDPNDPQTLSLTWSFQENETKIKLVYPDGSSETDTLVELSETTLKVSYVLATGGINITFVLTFTAQ